MAANDAPRRPFLWVPKPYSRRVPPVAPAEPAAPAAQAGPGAAIPAEAVRSYVENQPTEGKAYIVVTLDSMDGCLATLERLFRAEHAGRVDPETAERLRRTVKVAVGAFRQRSASSTARARPAGHPANAEEGGREPEGRAPAEPARRPTFEEIVRARRRENPGRT